MGNKKLKEDKRGVSFSVERVVAWIITAVCVFILIIVLVKLYNMNTAKSELEKAQESLNKINEKILLLKKSSGEDAVMIFPPKNWVLASYTEARKIPTGVCIGFNNCLCICSEAFCIPSAQRACNGYDFEIEVKGYRDNNFYQIYGIKFSKTVGEILFFNQEGKIIISEKK